MQAQHLVDSIPTQRISRSALFVGDSDYWATCRADDSDPKMYGPLMMPHAVPGEMLDSQKSEAVWNDWYGSRKEAKRAAEAAGRRLTEHEQTHSKKLEDLGLFTRLSRRLDLDLMRVAADQVNSDSTVKQGTFKLHSQEMMPLRFLAPALERHIGKPNCQQIYRLAMAAPAPDLAEAVESEFPFMRALHERGAFIRSTSQHLLGLACLLQTLAPEHNLPAVEKLEAKLLVTCLVRSLPARLGTLLLVTTPAAAECFDWPCRFYGVTAADLPGDADIWAKLPAEALDATVASLKAFTFPMYPDEAVNSLVRRLDNLAISAALGRAVALELNALHQDFLAERALSVHDEMKTFLNEGGIFFAAQPYAVPDDMVRPGYNVAVDGRERQAADSMFAVILSTYFTGPLRPLLEGLAERKLRLEKTGKTIEALSASGSPKQFAKIEGVGKRGMEELEKGRQWFVDEAMRLKGLGDAWSAFYGQLDAFRT